MTSDDSKIRYADLSDLVNRLKTVCDNQQIKQEEWNLSEEGKIYPLSQDILLLYNKFLNAQTNSNLASATRWTIDEGELNAGAALKKSTLNNAIISLVSMEGAAIDSKVANNAGTSYDRTTYTKGTTCIKASNSTDGTTYTESSHKVTSQCYQNTRRDDYKGNSKVCQCHTVYTSDNSQVANRAETTYSRITETITTYKETSHEQVTYTYTT